MFGALGTTFGLRRAGVRDLPGQPVGDRAAGAVLRGHGALDVRRLRGGAAFGAAGAPVARRRARVPRRVRDGPGRRDHRRALHRSAAGVAAGVRGHHPQRDLGLRCCSRPTAPASACRSGCWPGSRCRCRARAAGWSGSRASSGSRSSRPRSTTSRTSCPALARFGSGKPSFALDDGGAGAGRRRARRRARQLPRRRDRARAQGVRRRAGHDRRSSAPPTTCWPPRATWSCTGCPTSRPRWPTRARPGARCWSTSPPAGASPAASSRCGSSRARRSPRPCSASRSCGVDVSHEDDDPGAGRAQAQVRRRHLPAIRIVAPDGAIVGKTDTLSPPSAS